MVYVPTYIEGTWYIPVPWYVDVSERSRCQNLEQGNPVETELTDVQTIFAIIRDSEINLGSR